MIDGPLGFASKKIDHLEAFLRGMAHVSTAGFGKSYCVMSPGMTSPFYITSKYLQADGSWTERESKRKIFNDKHEARAARDAAKPWWPEMKQ